MLFIHWTNGQNNFFKVPSCTDIKLRDIPEEVFEKCKEPDMVIHCLPDENDKLGLSCFSVTWIEAGNSILVFSTLLHAESEILVSNLLSV